MVLVLAFGLPACSSGGTSNTWAPAGVKVVDGLGRRLRAAFPSDCADFGISGRANYVANSRLVQAPLPNAVGECTVLTETTEIASFDTPAHRDAFVETRAKVLCARAAAGKVGLPGLRWVVGDSWSIQPDSEGVALRLAAALHATYRLTACPGVSHADWEPAAVTRATALAHALVDAHLGCADLQFQDRDLLSTAPQLAGGLPAAYGRCSVGDNPNVDIAVFSPTSRSIGSWVPLDLKVTYCPSAPNSVAVVDGDWAAFTTDPAIATKVQATLGGSTHLSHCAT